MKKINRLTALLVANIFIFCATPSNNNFTIEDVEFYSNDTQLSGSIVLPKNGKIIAAVVFIHGSGRQERNLEIAQKFASQGIAALVYDKRGVGKSEGIYVQDGNISEKNLNLLADDAVAAIEILHKHKSIKGLPVGLVGISQAGWIAPLAAVKSPITRFLGLWSGPVCKVSEEDIYSKYTSNQDFDHLPSFEYVQKTMKEPYIWPERFGKDIDPSESLLELDIPSLWIFGGKDGSIPVDLSISRLKLLVNKGKQNYEYVIFSGLGHENIDLTFSTMTSWIKKTINKKVVSAKFNTLKSEELDKYLGIYVSSAPPIRVSLTKEDTGLILETKGEIFKLESMGNNNFYNHQYGYGYYFFEFYPNEENLIIKEHGNMYTLKKEH